MPAEGSTFSTWHLLRHPGWRKPDPALAQVDLGRLVLIGIAAWVVALAVCAGLWLSGEPGGPVATATCGAGIVLGLLGLAWVRSRPPAPSPAIPAPR